MSDLPTQGNGAMQPGLNGAGTVTVIKGSKAAPLTDLPVSTEVTRITPERAQRMLDGNHFEGQRELNKVHVLRLAVEMRAGRYIVSEIRLVHVGNRAYLTDGQHRLWAVLETGMPIDVTITHIQGTCMDDVWHDYVRTQPATGGRTAVQQLRALHIAERAMFDRAYLNHINAAVKLIMSGFGVRADATTRFSLSSPDVVASNIMEWRPQIHDYQDIMEFGTPAYRSLMRRGAVMAVAFVTLRHSHRAYAFWSDVARDRDLRMDDPAHLLVKFLTLHPPSSLPANTLHHWVAAHWNLYIKGETRTIVRNTKRATDPMYLMNTPYRRATR